MYSMLRQILFVFDKRTVSSDHKMISHGFPLFPATKGWLPQAPAIFRDIVPNNNGHVADGDQKHPTRVTQERIGEPYSQILVEPVFLHQDME